MTLAIINGSPRNKTSNSKILIDHFLAGYHSVCSDEVSVHYLASSKTRSEGASIVDTADTLIMIFPLYTDCMPGIVKEFIENISRFDIVAGKKIGFIVQSGFPEALQSEALSRYLEKLARRLNMEYLGIVIKGGVEGIQIMPPAMTRKLFARFYNLGVGFARNNTFDPAVVKALGSPYKLSALQQTVYKLMGITGIANLYWNSTLKKNGAYERRFARPYA
jgi:NAD(P)H-dependent FMN reductase